MVRIHLAGKAAQRFLDNTGFGTYADKNTKSVGGRIGNKKNFIGGTVGIDKGKLFANANVNGKSVGRFGPQGDK